MLTKNLEKAKYVESWQFLLHARHGKSNEGDVLPGTLTELLRTRNKAGNENCRDEIRKAATLGVAVISCLLHTVGLTPRVSVRCYCSFP